MNPNERINSDNINTPSDVPTAPAASTTQAQESPFSQPTPQVPQTPPVNPAVNPNTNPAPVQPAATPSQQPTQTLPTATPFALPAQMIQRVSNPGVEYYREDTMQKAHEMRDILHKQPKAWTMVPLSPGEKPESMLPVGINGYFVYVRKGVMVEVPFQIAQMIADSFNQDRLIGAAYDLSLNEDKQRALQR